MNGLLGKKIGMTQIYSEDGVLIPVTLIQAGPCSVLQIKTLDVDGYSAVQLGFDDKKKKNAKQPEVGHAAKATSGPKRFIKEVSPEQESNVSPGQTVTVDIFRNEKMLQVTGLTKGKGFAGVMKRWNFKGGNNTHGSTRHRPPGSIGSNTYPGRVFRGKKMAGRLGAEQITVKNLDVVKIDTGKNLLFVKGAVPGHKGSYLILNKSMIKKR
ncbi:MAG: 50S ribosomal protein L3 [Candidatus Brocadiaceae baterium WH-1]|nr:MAG: 50S ribosomal protein L3 [Candidatus Jettenia sp. AMX2]